VNRRDGKITTTIAVQLVSLPPSQDRLAVLWPTTAIQLPNIYSAKINCSYKVLPLMWKKLKKN